MKMWKLFYQPLKMSANSDKINIHECVCIFAMFIRIQILDKLCGIKNQTRNILKMTKNYTYTAHLFPENNKVKRCYDTSGAPKITFI